MTFQNKFLGKTQEQVAELSEADIETRVCNYANKHGCVVDKFTAKAKRSVPDRIITFPNGWIVFVEFKKEGKVPTEKQALDHEKRRANNAQVFVVDDVDRGKALIDQFLQFPILLPPTWEDLSC